MLTDLTDFHSGDSINYYFTDPNFPTSDYDLRIILTNDNTKHEIDTTKDSGKFYLNVADTSYILADRYKVYALFTKTGEKKTLFVNYINVKVNIDVSTAEEIISYNQKMLTAIEDLMFKRTETDYSSYTIGNRSIVKMTPDSLLKWRNYFKDLVEKEEMKRNGKRDVITIRWTGRV